ncbi:MAG: redoxin family protein [Verrucomicrobiota bacterium]
MITTKSLLCAAGLILAGLLKASAGEFPDDWTWDSSKEQRDSHATLEGKPMPSLAGLSEWRNGEIKSADLKGKVVVVDFYATWCGPCMKAVPHNNELLKKYKDKGLVVLGVCTSSKGQEKFADNAKEHGMEYVLARDAEQKIAKAWQAKYYPTYAIVDRKGVVRIIGLRPEHVESVVKKLLDEPAS